MNRLFLLFNAKAVHVSVSSLTVTADTPHTRTRGLTYLKNENGRIANCCVIATSW
jgi:hypothetical protein